MDGKEGENKIEIMNQIVQDSTFETLSEINCISPFPDDSFSKSPFNNEPKVAPKIAIDSIPTIERPFKDIIRRMQDEIDALLHENAELKLRQSTNLNCCSCQSVNYLLSLTWE